MIGVLCGMLGYYILKRICPGNLFREIFGRRQSDEVRKERGEYIGFEKRLIQFIMYDYLVY